MDGQDQDDYTETCGCPPATSVGCHGAETPEHWEWIERMSKLPR
jgi:hypothetical protein